MKSKFKFKLTSPLLLTLFFLLLIVLPTLSALEKGESNLNATFFGLDDDKDVIGKDVGLARDADGEDVHAMIFEGGHLKIKKDGQWREYGGFKGISTLIFKETQLVEADFELAEERTLHLGDSDHKLPAGTKVKVEDGKVTITLPKGAQLSEPEVTGSADERQPVTYQIPKDSNIILPNGETLKPLFEDDSSSLEWDSERKLFSTERAQIENIAVGTHIGKKELKKTYLIFDEGNIHNDFDSPYVSFGNKENNYKLTIGSNGAVGPNIQFLPGTKYAGLEIKPEYNLVIQARDGHITLESQGTGRFPKITTKGGHFIFAGSALIRYNEGDLSSRITKVKFADGRTLFGDTKAPSMHIIQQTKTGKKIAPWDIFIDPQGKIAGAEWSAQSITAVNQAGTVVSDYSSIYQLSSTQRTVLQKLSNEQQLAFLRNPQQFLDESVDLKRALEYSFETSADESAGAMQIVSQNNVESTQQGTLTRIAFLQGSSFKIKTNRGEAREYSSITGTIIFDKFGEPVAADFVTSAERTLKFGNEEIKLPKRSEEHTSELQSHSFISYAVFCLKKKKK